MLCGIRANTMHADNHPHDFDAHDPVLLLLLLCRPDVGFGRKMARLGDGVRRG
jgi:hypothetical protein